MRAFLAFTSFKSHAWRGSPCWHRGPSLTTEPPSKKLAFPSCGRRVSPIQAASCHLQSGHGEVPPGHPALPFRLYLSDSESWSPVGRWREPPGQTTLPFPPHGRRDLPIQTASIFLPSDVGESLPATHLTFLCLYLSNAASLDLPLDAGEVLLARLSCYYVFTCPTQRVLISRWTPARCSRPDKTCFLLSLPVQHGESWSPVGRRRGAPGQTILLSLSLPVQHSKSWYLVGRRRGALGQTNLTFPVFTCPTRESQSPVGRRRGAPGQTNALPSARTKNIEPRRTRHTRPFWQA